MAHKRTKNIRISVGLPDASTTDLKGKQSVRTTFKLSERTIRAVSVVASHLGIKQKSLFDHLMDDIEALRTIAHSVQHSEKGVQPQVQKTYVVSRKSLESLERVSKNFKTPRDALVEYSVQRLWPIIEEERKKHKKRKLIVADLFKHLDEGKKILRKSKQLLDKDDPVHEQIALIMEMYESCGKKIESYIEKGDVIEEL